MNCYSNQRNVIRQQLAGNAISLVLMLFLSVSCATPSYALDVVRDPSLDRWVEASKNSRADILVLGDSMVLNDSHGWDAGLHLGAHQTVGLAGTGLLNGRSLAEGEGLSYQNTYDANWTDSATSAYGDVGLPGYGRLTTVGNSTASVGIRVSGDTLNTKVDYVLDMWAVGGPGGGTYSVQQGPTPSPFTPTYEESGLTLPDAPEILHRSHEVPANDLDETEVRIEAQNTSLSAIRLTEKDATGVTITSVGYGGQSTLDFYQDRWTNRGPEMRQLYLQQVVEGGSGKLLVPIFEGLNDRNEDETSVNGIVDGDSPEAFRDNVGALISVISGDWVNAGYDLNDLSFMTFGMYGVQNGNDDLSDLSSEIRDFASVTEGVSYLDISSLGPDYTEGEALGYYADGIHLSREGALYYGNQIMQSIVTVPEPTTAALMICFASIGTLVRRR